MSATPVQKNPFPGLRPFTPEEDYLFFGREEQTLALLQRLGSNRFVAVVGTSGSGKSSLVRCGLLSELLGGGMLEAGAVWQIAVTHPGGNPLALLTGALLEADLYDREVEHSRENLLATLSRSHFGLVEAVKQADLPAGTNFLLVVDQFEEIFRFQDAGQRQQEIANEFVSLLLEAVAQKEVPIYVVLTMRSDFIGECSQFEGLAEMVNRGEFLIPRLTREQYKRVIEGPVKVAGGQIAPRLLQRLLNDLGQQADQLPCLQHALMRTWDLWAGKGDDKALDLDDYQRVGKMSQALSLHADEIYESLSSDRQRELCRGMFQALTAEESNSRGIRRPQRLSHLCQILEVEADELRPIIDAYRQSGVTFLMPSPEVELTDQTIIDISHESLMRVWTQLRQWVAEETQASGIYHRLSESADLHAQGQAGLYRDPELGIALAWQESKRPNAAWADRYRPGFAKAIGFLEASQRASVADEQAREAARQRELEQAHQLTEAQRQRALLEQRTARRLRVLAAGMALVALFAAGASIVAVNSWWAADSARQTAQRSEQAARDSAAEAQREAERATAQETLAKEARDEAEIRAYTASLAAAAADLQRNDSRTLRRRLESAPQRLRGWEWTYLWNESDRSLPTTLTTPLTLPPTTEGYRMDLSGDSKLVAVRALGGNGEPITVYDTQTGAQIASLKTYSSSKPMMTFSADKKLLAYHHHGTPGVQLYNLATGLPLIPRPLEFRAFLGFDPPGERVVLLTDQYKIRIFKTADFSQIAELPDQIGADDFRRRGAISADGKLLVVGAFRDDPMRIFDLTSNKLLKKIEDADAAVALQFDDTGSTVTTVSPTGVIAEYAAPEWKKTLQTQEARQERGGLAVHRLDRQLLRLSFDSTGAVALFDLRLTRSATLHGHGVPGESIAVDKEQEQIVTAHRDGSLRRWDLRHPQELRLETRSVAFTPDGDTAYAALTADSYVGRQLGAVDPVAGRLQGFLHRFPFSVSHSSMASQVAYSPEGRHIAVATSSGWGQGHWRIYDSWTGLADHEALFPEGGDLECIGWSADGQWIAVGGRAKYLGDGLTCLYNASTHQMVAKLAGGAGGVHALAFNPNGRQLTTASADGVLRLWDVPGGKLHSSIGKPGDPGVNCVAYSSDGSYLVAGLADGTVAAWNSSSREPIFRSQVHGAGVKCLAFTPDGSRLMTAAADQSLKVFDPATWRELLTLYLEDSAGGMSFSPDGKRLALATGSLMWLETEAETKRTQQRRLAREAEQRAISLLQEIFSKSEDPLEGRKQILAQTTSDEVLRRVSLRVLQVALTNAAYQAYQAPKLDEQVALELLRQQILLDKGGHATAAQKEQLLAGIKARLVLPSIQRQALVEYATAVANWEILHGTTEQAWEIVADPKRSADDQLVVYFGLEPQKRKAPQSAKLLKILAGAEYRVGLYADALESAQKGLTLSTEDKPASAHLLAVVAMAQHRSGQAEQAVETVKQLDNLLQDSTVKTDKIAMALNQESRATLAAPLDKPWDDEAAISTCKERMKKLQLDEAKIAAWAAKSAARRHVAKGDLERAAAAFGSALGAAKDRATKANLITDAARLPGVLERLAELTPSDGMLQAELARQLAEQGNLAAANAARDRAVQSIQGELAKDSENAALATDLADVLLIEATQWTILKPSDLTSQGGETMTVERDGSIFVSGPTPDRAVYTLTFPTDLPTLSLLRLETLPDARLPSGGAGRTSHGNFHVSELTAAIESEQPGAKPTPIDFGLAVSDDQSNPQLSLDRDSQTIWDTWPNHLQPHWAVFAAKSPVPLEGSTLTITLDSGTMHGGKHGLGRFRLSVCDDPTQFGKEQKRIAAMKIADPWAKLGAAYALAGNIERASDLFAKSGFNGIGAALKSGLLADEVLDALQSRHPQLYASVLPGSASAAAERGQVEHARSHFEQLAKLQPEQSRWKERAEQLQPGVLAAWNFDSSLGGWGDARNCDVSIKDGVLTLRTTAPDPQFSMRLSSSAGGKAVVLRYRSSEAFTMQVFWSEGLGGFDDAHRLDYPIPAAASEWSEIALPFWCHQDLNALRLDPDTSSEHPLEIDSLVLRRAEPDEYKQAVSKVLIEPELARLAQGIAANPMSAPAYAARATFFTRLGRWREAADDFEQERKLAQPDRLNYFKVSNCRLLAGDVGGHQQLCREMVAQFRETSDANVADSVCKICLLGPSEINFTKLPITLLREATSDPQQKDNRHWFVACCALIAYREGNYEKSVEWTKEMPEFNTQSGALALVVRALAEQRLGQVDQARETLAQAETVIPPELRSLGTKSYAGPLPVSPDSVSHDWLAPEILRRVAEKLIRGTAASQH